MEWNDRKKRAAAHHSPEFRKKWPRFGELVREGRAVPLSGHPRGSGLASNSAHSRESGSPLSRGRTDPSPTLARQWDPIRREDYGSRPGACRLRPLLEALDLILLDHGQPDIVELNGSVPSHRDRFSAAFITNIAESRFSARTARGVRISIWDHDCR